MKKVAIIGVGLMIIVLGIVVWKYRGVTPIISDSLYPEVPATAENTTGLPLTVQDGLKISIYAKSLGSPRVLVWDPKGVLIVSIPDQGRVVALPDENHDGVADKTVTVVFNLNKPHGLAFYQNTLYVAETNKVVAYEYNAQTQKANNPKKLYDLPTGGQHGTRSLVVKDKQLFVSTGSTCNICEEKDSLRAAVWVSDLDGKNLRAFATGLRNSPFMTLHPKTQEIWATEMGRDELGDDIPPDEINILKQDKNYGWPICYGQKIHDTTFDKKTYIQDPCNTTVAAQIDLQAHSAPLGLAFVPDSWPKQFSGKLVVAFHGSWNRTVPTGYKVVIIDPETKSTSDLITGWLSSNTKAVGRPVGLLFGSDNILYISDDKAGNIYQVTPLLRQ